MVNSRLSLQDILLLVERKLIRYKELNYSVKDIEKSISEILHKENYWFNQLISLLVFTKLDQFTRDSLFSYNFSTPIVKTLLRGEKELSNNNDDRGWNYKFVFDSTLFLGGKKNFNGLMYQNYMQSIIDLSSDSISSLYNLSSDLFLYSLSRNSKKIQLIKEKILSIDEGCWKTLEQNVVLPTKSVFKNIEEYDTGLKDFEVQPIAVHKNLPLYYKNRRISILSQIKAIKSKVTKIIERCDTRDLASFDPCDSKAQDSISDHPNIPIEQVALILSPFDYHDFREFIDPSGERTCFLNIFFGDWQKQGMTIYKHESVKPGDCIIFEKGTFLLFNFLSLLKRGKPFPKMDFYEDITTPSVFLKIGCYCTGKNVCLPMHYQEESYEQINFLALKKTKWYFLYTWNNPKFRKSCMKTLLLLLPILCEILKNRFAGSS